MDNLNGKIALVTGASIGIGRAIAEGLAKAGADVAINYFQHQAEAEEACAFIRSVGRRALAVQADVSKSAEVTRLVKTVEEELGPIEILVNNSGMARPQPLEETTKLADALKQSIEHMTEGCALDVSFAVTGASKELPLFVEDALYRVAQESIANALRHGDPKSLCITLDNGARVVRLTVIDNGRGFDPSEVDESGFGLSGMRQRIRALHGTFTITSKRGEGTQVTAEVPRRSVTLARFKSLVNAYRNYYRKMWRVGGTA